MTGSRINTLVLHATHAPLFSYLDDWLDAFTEAPQFAVTALDIRRTGTRGILARRRDEFDLIVLLHSTNGDWLHALRRLAPLLAERRTARLLSFVGNEVNLPGLPLADKIALLRQIGPDIIATQLLEEAGQFLYGTIPRCRVVSIPHGLNPRAFRAVAPAADRPIDIGSRSAAYAAYLGDDDRRRLLELFATHPFQPALRVDVSTTERFDRAGWAAFLNRCKGTIASEAGSWYLEPDDRTMTAIRDHVLRGQKRRGFVLTQDSPLQRLAMFTPQPLRRAIRKILRRGPVTVEVALYDDLPFQPIYDRFFRGRPRAPVYAKCISSRHLDAIGTRTAQILIRGRYNDMLRADEHYLALESDFSNLDDVVRRFRDPGERARLVDAAHAHVMAHHTYGHRMAAVAALVGA